MSKEKKEAKKAAKAEKKANKQPKNPDITKSIISAVTAVICVVAVAVTSMSISDKICDVNINVAKESPKAAAAVNGAPSGSDGTASDSAPADEYIPEGEDAAAPSDEGTPAGEDASAADTSSADSAQSSSGASSQSSSSQTSSKPADGKKVPSTKAEIAKVYNDAVNKVISSKAGYSKKRNTKLGQLEGAEAIMKIQVAKDAVYDFLGVGDTVYTNKKGKADFLSNAALTEADLTSATCTEAGGVYSITLNLKDGTSAAPGTGDTSPLQRSGLYAGSGDKKDYDYKNASNIYLGLNNSGDASVQSVSEKISKTKITAKVDSATGKLISLNASWHWDADLKKVKYTIITISGIGHADTSVTLSGIQW